MKMKCVLVTVSVALWTTVLAELAAEGSCPVICECKWKNGKQAVDCLNRSLITVPQSLDPATQLLNLSWNNLQILPKEVFVKTGLSNLQRIYLRHCSIGEINDHAFAGLTNLVELDLSNNLLTQIPSKSFNDVPFLRDLMLAENPILKVHSDALSHLGSVVKLDLSKCEIREIADDAFRNLKSLESLKLNHNKLKYLPLASLERLERLKAIDLSGNQWTCDCRLKELKMWLVKQKLRLTPSCSAPSRLANRLFSELSIEEFACIPEILTVGLHVVTEVGQNATIICKTEAIPSAQINWYWNGRLLKNGSHINTHQKTYIYEEGDLKKKSTLVLTNTQEADPIEFFCVAGNNGGNAEANFTLHVRQPLGGMASLGYVQIATISFLVAIVVVFFAVIATFVRYRTPTECESKTPNTLDREASGNEEHPVIAERPRGAVLVNRHEPVNLNDPKCNSVLKPPRVNNIPYTTNRYEERGSLVTAGGPLVVSPTVSVGIDPDLINGTRPNSATRPGSGEYEREGSDSLYPSGFWDQMNMTQATNLARAVSLAMPANYNDRTPIIEKSIEDGSQEQLGYMSRTFPRSHEASAVTAAPGEAPYPPDFGLPVAIRATGAAPRTLRVWQHGPPVLPPVAALKRVLTRARATDDCFENGCATDV